MGGKIGFCTSARPNQNVPLRHNTKENNSSSCSSSKKKPETFFLSRARNRRNNATRYIHVMKKGMQKRASDKKETATRELEGDDEMTKTITYQSNFLVGAIMVFVVRIRDDVGVPKVCKNVLERMRLKNIHDGVFVRYDATARKSLHLVL
jgi:ribosomal protein L30/L7E